MDIIFTVLVLIILVLCNLLIGSNKKKFKRLKYGIYILLICIIVILVICYYNKRKPEKYQSGGAYNKQKKINELLDRCKLPRNYSKTSHCFRDNTHQTCCMLSPSVRKYADTTGNEIGKASVKAYKKYLKQQNLPIPSDDELANMSTPWCTCLGAQVCSNYKFNKDTKTKIKFINNKQDESIVNSPNPKCELFISDKFLTRIHNTPGVNKINHNISDSICENELLKKTVNII